MFLSDITKHCVNVKTCLATDYIILIDNLPNASFIIGSTASSSAASISGENAYLKRQITSLINFEN